MSRSALGFLALGVLIATSVLCVNFAAYCGSLELLPPIKEPQPDADEKTPPPETEEQQAAQITPCESQGPTAEQDDRLYLLETAHLSSTMIRLGPEVAIARLNPEFVARLASAIRQARQSGLPSVGIFSAYRPPAFGVSRFLDKFMSLHAYGLAVDMSGIGRPGSKEAELWHDIAARRGIICPYRFDSKKEWNHCQAIQTKMILPDNPLRKTITAEGPLELEEMFKVGNSLIDSLPAAITTAAAANEPEESEAVRPDLLAEAAVSIPERPRPRGLRQARNRSGDFASGRRSVRAKAVISAVNEGHMEKSHRKTPAESHQNSMHHRSHSAERAPRRKT